MIKVYARLAAVVPDEHSGSGTRQLVDEESGSPSDGCGASADGSKHADQYRVQKLLAEHRTLVANRRSVTSELNGGSDEIVVKKSRVINKDDFSTDSGRDQSHKAPETPKSGNGIHSSPPTHHRLVTKPSKGQHPQQKHQGK